MIHPNAYDPVSKITDVIERWPAPAQFDGWGVRAGGNQVVHSVWRADGDHFRTMCGRKLLVPVWDQAAPSCRLCVRRTEPATPTDVTHE